MLSIILPTYNNIRYLKLCIKSIKKNSKYNHEIILHINEGTDGTLEYAKKNELKFSYSAINNGICIGCNNAAKLSKYELLLYAHDDMYFCPNWDSILINESKKINGDNYYLSGTMIKNGHIHNYSCGDTIDDFDEKKLLIDHKKLNYHNFQGSTWAPTLIPKKLWMDVGGLSEEYTPGTGSDPDLNMKLWKKGVRIFKGMGESKVYHFGSIVTRQKEFKYLTKTETGNKGNKIFLLKWGITIKFFKKYYMRSDTKYLGPLPEPCKNFSYFRDLIKCKFLYCYIFLINKLNNKI